MHPSTLPIEILLKDCEVRGQRRSGPGGQHRNKVETGIFVSHIPTGLRAEATEFRSQPRNQEKAIFRLRLRMAIEYRSPKGADGPSKLWLSRLKGEKIQINESHDDFPAMIAEALDALSLQNWDPKSVKETLGCSSSQLVKLLKKEPKAFACLNRHRNSNGLAMLR